MKKIKLMAVCLLLIFPSMVLGAELSFSWLPNADSSLAGYRIYYGEESGVYGHIEEIGLPATINGRVHGTVFGLITGQTSYFAVVAYDTNGEESDYSRELVITVDAVQSSLPDTVQGVSAHNN